MEFYIGIGGLVLHILSEKELTYTDTLAKFFISPAAPDLTVRCTWDWESVPKPTGPFAGQDLLQNYYYENGHHFCATRGGVKGWTACAEYDFARGEILCGINEKPFLLPQRHLDSILRFLPARAMLQHFGVSFFHAAQIAVGEGGILFTAPSGTGKTTQAHLWMQQEGARLICNDRTLVRRRGGEWHTFGYPIDGSAPVCSTEEHPLRCIVLLTQAKENTVRRLSPARAIPLLMPQLVIDVWSAQARTTAMEQLIAIMREVPVYHLACTPDTAAVDCLKHCLLKEGVLHESDS